MSLWQHQGRLMYGTPNISRPATAGTNILRLSWHVLTGVRPLLVPREREPLVTCKSQRHFNTFCWQFPWKYNCTKHHTGSAVARVENQLGRRRKQLQTIAQWNVRTLLDREAADRPEKRTALVAMELAKYNNDIAALCETRFSESGSLSDLEYSFFRRCKPEGERTEAGVGFAIKMNIVTKCHGQ